MPDTDAILSEIREQLSAKDISTLDLLLSSFDPDKLDAEFYRKAAKDRNRFIREFFCLDLGIRNTKVEYLNSTLGRPEGTDIVILDPVLAVVVKLKMVERWLRLDEATGRELFRKLVKEIKENTKI